MYLEVHPFLLDFPVSWNIAFKILSNDLWISLSVTTLFSFLPLKFGSFVSLARGMLLGLLFGTVSECLM